MMSPSRWILVLLLFWTAPVWAAKHCLWQVRGENNQVYLLGSVHFLKKEYYPLPEPMESALEEAEIVVFEADIGELLNPQTQVKLLMQGLCPPEKTLRDFVSEDTYEKFKGQLGNAAIALERFRPWFAAVTVTALEVQRLGFDPEQGVDQYFYRKAKKSGKRTGNLETVQFQIELFTSLSKEDQEQFLLQSLTETAQLKSILGELATAWKTGDVAQLETTLLASMREFPEVEQKILIDRNRAWLPQIEEYLKGSTDVLVVVGAAHLVGKEGLIEQLAKKGYPVQQVEGEPAGETVAPTKRED